MDNFEKVIDKILDSIDFPREERDEVKANLATSIYLNFLASASAAPENKSIIDTASASKNLGNFEEFKKAVEEIKNKLSGSNFDFETTLKNSIKEKLNEFISELEPKFPPEKIAELKEAVNRY